ncbi:MAG: T9SS type A sorting domain-containing protein [Bacteroidota bacterium]
MKKNLLFYFTNSKSVYLLLLLLISGIGALKAQTPTFYTGNVNAPSNSFPFNNAAGKSMQSLIAAGELSGALFGNITKFYVQGTANVSATWSGLVIRMGQTSANTLPSGALYAGQLDTVLYISSAAATSTAAGWMQFTLTRPYLYDPTRSLVVEISQCASTGGFTVTNVGKPGSFRRAWNLSTCTPLHTGQDENLFNCGVDMSSASNNDVGAFAITSPGLFCAPGNQSIQAQIKNYGINQVNTVNVNWSINGTLQTPYTHNSLLDTFGGASGTSANITLGNYFFPATPTTIKVWTSSPNSLSDTILVNDTASGFFQPSLSGNYTINPSGSGSSNYTTIDAAVADMVARGICAPVTFTIANGSYSRTTALTIPAIAGANQVNTITFQGNGSGVCTIYGAIASSAVIVLNQTKYITIKGISVINTSATAPCGIAGVGGTQKVNISNCYIKVPVVTSTSSTGYVLNFTGSASGNGVSACAADSIVIDSNRLVGGGYGVVVYGLQLATVNRGIIVTNNTIDSCNYMGGYIAYNYNPIIFSKNTVNMQGGTNYGYYGVYFYYNRSSDLTQSHIITNNRINNFGYYGMYIYYPTNTNTATAKTIINNNVLIGASAGTTYAGAFGIYLYQTSAANTADVYHNTVAMLGNTTATTPAAFYNGISTVTNVKNNIFAVYTSLHVPVYLAANLNSGNLNNNLYYNSSTTGILVFRGGVYYNASNYLSNTAGGDSSLNSAPPFTSSPTLLRLANLGLTQACMVGTNVNADVPLDFNGATRSSIPTMGAYEFVNTTTDNLAALNIITPVAPITIGFQDARFRVKNIGNNTINFYSASYNLNGSFPVTLFKSVTLPSCGVDTIDFNGANQINLSTTNNIAMYTESPNGVPDTDRSNDTLKTILKSPLNGVYTIGGGGANFSTPQLAAVALKDGGVTGPVTFTFNPGTYTGQLQIQGPIAGNTDLNPIVFDGVNAATSIITANVAQSAIVISDARYVTVKNLTVTNTNTGAGTGGVAIAGNIYSNNGSSCAVIKNIINLPNVTSTTSYGIIVTGTPNGTAASNNNVDSITIDSNVINGGNYGIELYGNTTSPSSSIGRGHLVRYNTINSAYNMGMHIYYIYNPVDVIGNTINMHTTTTAASYGLYFYYCQNNSPSTPHRILNNKIINANAYGMYVYWYSSPVSAPMQVYNNIVTGSSRYAAAYYAAYIYSGAANANVNIYHNTLIANSTSNFQSIYGLLYYNTTGSVQNIKNNIFGIQTALGGPINAPLYFSNVAAANVNYNTYYNLTSSYLVFKNAIYYNSSNYRVASIGGDSSFSNNPNFSNILVPVLSEGCTRGANLTADVPKDYTGALRSTSPNVGAYEYSGTSNDVSLEALLYPFAPVTLGAQDLAVRVRNNGTNVVSSFSVSYTLNNGFPVVYNWFGTLNPCDTTTVIFNSFNQITLTSGSNNIKVFTENPNYVSDGYKNNDTIKVSFETPLNGNYVIGVAPSDFTTFTAAVNALTARGVSGPVTFRAKKATYTESINLGAVAGASLVNRITFTSIGSHPDSVTLAWTSSTTNNPYVVRFTSEANYFIFDKITFSQLSSTAAYHTIMFQGIASFDTIRNCVIKQPINSSYTSVNIYGVPYNGEGLVIDNNSIRGGYYGIYLNGASRTSGMKNVVLNANTLTDYYYSPVYYLQYTRNAKFTNNIFNPVTGGIANQYSYFYYNDSGFVSTNNVYNSITGKTFYWYNYYSNNSSTNKSLIANNQFKGAGINYFYAGNTGTTYQDIVHNTFNMNGGYFYIAVGTINNVRVLNNVMSSTGTYAYYFSAAPSSFTLTSDYNSVYTSGSTTPYYATAARTAAAFKTAYPGLELNTMNVPAGLTSATDLRPNATSNATWSLNGRGLHIGYAINDVNNAVRPQTFIAGTPDIGAFEFTPTATPVLLTATPATPTAGGTQVFMYNEDTAATITWDAFATPPASISGRLYSGVYPPGMTGNTHAALNMYWDISAPTGVYGYTINLYYKPTMQGSVPLISNMMGTKKSGSGPWTFYTTPQTVIDPVRNILTINSLTDFSLFTGTDASNPLPVKLSSFEAVAQRSNVFVSWTTASERNASYFEVYSSADGRNFAAASNQVKAKGNTSTPTSYQFTDVNAFAAANTVYYKLKSTDRDGSTSWSDVAIVNNNRAANSISVYPNPFSNEFSIVLPSSGEAGVVITSLQGETLMTTTVHADHQAAVIKGLDQLKTGVYFVKVTHNGTTYVEKLVKN